MLAFQVLWRRGLGGAFPNVSQHNLLPPPSSLSLRQEASVAGDPRGEASGK